MYVPVRIVSESESSRFIQNIVCIVTERRKSSGPLHVQHETDDRRRAADTETVFAV